MALHYGLNSILKLAITIGKQKNKSPKKQAAANQQQLIIRHHKEYDKYLLQLLHKLDVEWVYTIIGRLRREMLYDCRPLKLYLQQKGGSPNKMFNEYINSTFTNLINRHEIRYNKDKLPHSPDMLHNYLSLYKQYKQKNSSWQAKIEPATCNDEQVQEAMLDNDVELQSHQCNIKVGSIEEQS